MNRVWHFLPFALSILWYLFLSTTLSVSGNHLPPLGSFFGISEGFWANAKSQDQVPASVQNDFGIQGEVYLDERRVPHIFANTERDAYFLQGYVHAWLRLWQIDFSTRAAEGRLSEIIGERTLSYDKIKRRKGFREAAMRSVENWKRDPELLKSLNAYSDGINQYISSLSYKDLPIEYKLLDYWPEPWSLYRSALFHKSMAEILCGRDKDVELTNARLFFGSQFANLFPEMEPKEDPVIPPGTEWKFTMQESLPVVDSGQTGYIDWIPEKMPAGLGSNNWAVAARKSANGHPLLCNDPHLNLTLPSIWFEQQLITPDYNVYGVTFPGIPGVVIGFNDHIAWGVTNAGWDVMDWYQIQWQDEKKTHYLLDGKWVEVKNKVEKIHVKGHPDVLDTVLMTYWGPVVYTDTASRKNGLAMHWIVNDPYEQMEVNTFRLLNRAKNYADYRNAVFNFPYPAQNFAFASVDGDIALTTQGNMPIKSDQQGRFVLDGSKSENAWKGVLPSVLNPHTINPERGFVSSANQRTTDSSFPNYYNNGDFREYRGRMINRLLSQKEKWSVEDMKALHYNSYSLKAEEALPLLLTGVDSGALDDKGHVLYTQLKNWNYNYDSTSQEAVYFDLWFAYFYKCLWDEILMDSTKRAIATPDDVASIRLMKTDPGNVYFDFLETPKKEVYQDIARMSFDSMKQQVSRPGGPKDWADFKDASILHIARIPAFSRFHVRTSGNEDIINAHARAFGPSWRMIVDLAKDNIKAFGIYPGGQSGNPGSAFYDSMILPWSKGAYYELHFLKSQSEANPDYQVITFH